VGPPELIAMMLRVGSDSGTVATTHTIHSWKPSRIVCLMFAVFRSIVFFEDEARRLKTIGRVLLVT
jgi:hypothetical protein